MTRYLAEREQGARLPGVTAGGAERASRRLRCGAANSGGGWLQGMALDRDIARYYRRGAERRRLREPGGRLEFVRTQELLSRFLRSPPAIVVDVGGGGGVHAVPLAAVGYEVELLDPVELHVEQARVRARAGRAVASARGRRSSAAVRRCQCRRGAAARPAVSPDRSRARLTALAEARRVLRSGGVLAAMAISRFASTFDGLAHGFLAEPRFERIVERDVCDGQHRNPDLERQSSGSQRRTFTIPTSCVVNSRTPICASRRSWRSRVRARFARSSTVGSTTSNGVTGCFERSARVETQPTVLGASAHLLAFARA